MMLSQASFRSALFALCGLLATCGLLCPSVASAAPSEQRYTPLVRAVQRAQGAVVNVFGEKLAPDQERFGNFGDGRRVNGMGTGMILDARGYILTNYHVVEGVEKLQVMLADNTTLPAKLIAFDAAVDLAIIRVDAGKRLPVISIGRSDDLMAGESVAAIGNAYGYGHTVTRGIVSALNRTVQVTETQNYEDLIQTDAPINPGNSGGPLVNIEGEMIGVNVAVRAGAQGIGFAIPADKAMEVAARLMASAQARDFWHGMRLADRDGQNEPAAIVKEVEPDSPAAAAGVQVGDRVELCEEIESHRALDIERGLLEKRIGDEAKLVVRRGGERVELKLTLAEMSGGRGPVGDLAWDTLGLRLKPTPASVFRQVSTRYRGGLTVTEVKEGSQASRQGIRPGDVLVGMHEWETVSLDNVKYILTRVERGNLAPLKFYIVRGTETLYGFLPLRTAQR